MHRNSTFLRTDVTAVIIHPSGIILAGIGSNLYVYSEKNELLSQQQCLSGQKIYGLIPNFSKDSYIIFGGKQFTIVVRSEMECSPQFSRMFAPLFCEDWLHSALWAPHIDQVVLLTAHNVVLCYNIHTLSCSRHVHVDNSILYSGLLVPIEQDIIVMAGTVYSEVILQVWGEAKPLHCLKGHKGVIFSISCHPLISLIVTTSDDRSVRIWGPKLLGALEEGVDNWRDEIVCKYELYGHHARVMRSIINDSQIISVGEDSHICFWSFGGVLMNRIRRHQNAGIWSIAATNQLLVTGGGDGAVITQDISTGDDSHTSHFFSLDSGKPKQIAYTAKGNFFILLENNIFIYYDNQKHAPIYTQNLLEQHVTAYHSLSMSPCTTMCALAGRKANLLIAVENEQLQITFETVILDKDSVLSVHWASEDTLVACLENGQISIVTRTNEFKACTIFELPQCKERWLTCSAVNHARDTFILGDRSGGLHMFRKETKSPIKSISKLHGRYGPTSITILKDELITTGRDRMIKHFRIAENDLINTGSFELDFHWVERFLDIKERLVCGFKEKMFVIHNLKLNEHLLEIDCGGGHRSYDVLYHKENNKNILKLAYVKSSLIHTDIIQLNKYTTTAVISGSHSKEINCLKTLQADGKTVFLSGGEDTTIRVSVLDGQVFEDILYYKQLSSIKTLKICKNQQDILCIAAGGRAQISIKAITFSMVQNGHNKVEIDTRNLVDYMIKGTDRQRKGVRSWKNVTLDIDPETRIMDLDYIRHNDGYTIFTGCSDGSVRVFDFKPDVGTFEMVKESWHPHCIIKTVCMRYLNQDLLITGSTRGGVAFWRASDLALDSFLPFFVTHTNKSGINCIVCKIIDNRILVATGGDDNALHLQVLQANQDMSNSMQVLHSLVLDGHHSSAITGLCLVGDHLVSTSIDQRITLYNCKVDDKIKCHFVYQTYSDVADIKGMDVISCDRFVDSLF